MIHRVVITIAIDTTESSETIRAAVELSLQRSNLLILGDYGVSAGTEESAPVPTVVPSPGRKDVAPPLFPELSVRVRTAVVNAGYTSPRELHAATMEDLLDVRNLGPRGIEEIRAAYGSLVGPRRPGAGNLPAKRRRVR